MDELYSDWKVIVAPEKVCHSTKGLRTEVLWVNYDINNIYLKAAAFEDRNLYAIGHLQASLIKQIR